MAVGVVSRAQRPAAAPTDWAARSSSTCPRTGSTRSMLRPSSAAGSVSSQIGHRRKTDQVDAYSVAVAALTGTHRIHRNNQQAEFLCACTASTATTSSRAALRS